jgi:NADH-quinone oxidoreductase subunit A
LLFYFFVYQQYDIQKISAYECGFNPFFDARIQFEVKFYLIGILFIIFDIEISFLFPWIIAINSLSFIAIFSMIFFIFILTLGFIYEWLKGALDW